MQHRLRKQRQFKVLSLIRASVGEKCQLPLHDYRNLFKILVSLCVNGGQQEDVAVIADEAFKWIETPHRGHPGRLQREDKEKSCEILRCTDEEFAIVKLASTQENGVEWRWERCLDEAKVHLCLCQACVGRSIQAVAQVQISNPCSRAMRRDRPSCSWTMFHACNGGRERPAGFTLVFSCVARCSCQDETRDVLLSGLLSAPNILLWFALGRIYERVIDPPQMEITPGSGVWLGQHSHKHGLFKVTLTHARTHTHSLSLCSLP